MPLPQILISDVSADAAAWVPAQLLAALVLSLLGALFVAVTYIGKILLERLTKMETTLSAVKESMPSFATAAQLEAVREQMRAGMRSMGDGFDLRLQKVSDRVAVVENDLGKEIAVRQAIGSK
jgi:cell division protein FtsB